MLRESGCAVNHGDLQLRLRLLLLVGGLLGCGLESLPDLQVATFNVLNDDSWAHRAAKVSSAIRSADADLVALQELNPVSAGDIARDFPDYDLIAADRGDGRGLTGLLTRKGRFCELAESVTVYTSTTPAFRDSAGYARPVVCWSAGLPHYGATGAAHDVTFCSVHVMPDRRGLEPVMVELRRALGHLPGLILAGDFNWVASPNPWMPAGAPSYDDWLVDPFAALGHVVPLECEPGRGVACPESNNFDARIDLILADERAWSPVDTAVVLPASAGASDHPLMRATVVASPTDE